MCDFFVYQIYANRAKREDISPETTKRGRAGAPSDPPLPPLGACVPRSSPPGSEESREQYDGVSRGAESGGTVGDLPWDSGKHTGAGGPLE